MMIILVQVALYVLLKRNEDSVLVDPELVPAIRDAVVGAAEPR